MPLHPTHHTLISRKLFLNAWIRELDKQRMDESAHSPAERALMHDEIQAAVELRDLLVLREQLQIDEAKTPA